ncbi:MAG TPA: NAD(+)/NADH kinase [Blastocatellia bacterium]|nr:NAD(+)/NADH kinase [Blastocatellia bacterium]
MNPLTMQPPSRLGIITKPGEPRAAELAARIAEWAANHEINLFVNDRVRDLPAGTFSASAREIADNCDLLIALGGDGTMISTARLVSGKGTPVLGINLGTLGYLTEFAIDDAMTALETVIRGEYELDRRMMLDWRVLRDGDQVGAGTALNDVVVNKSALARIIDIDCWIGPHYVTGYRADGLIVATPTGSTAYNLSAGGPIIVPGAEAISICPICPHTLTNRPLVLPFDVEIKLQMNTREQEVMFTADGQTGMPLMTGDRVEISRSAKTFNTVRAKDRDYFEILRSKLKWSGR